MLSLSSVCINTSESELIKNFSITFLPNSIVYFRGKNGCGKTSLLRAIAGINRISSGQITFGKDNIPIEYLAKPYCVYIGHKTGVKLELTVIKNIEFWAKTYNSPELVSEAIFYFKLEDYIHTKCYALSAGQKQKVALAKLLACSSHIWLLDEVENNLDTNSRELLDNLITSKANNRGIIIASSHTEPLIQSALTIDWASIS